MGSKSGVDGVLDVAIVAGGKSGPTSYPTPDGRYVAEVSNAVILFSDDFGGTAVNTATRWDVLDGGLAANQALPSSGKSLTQGAIGSGTNMGNGVDGAANTALTVSASALAITMGTTNGAELWLLSQQAFAGTEDLFFTLQKSQALAANSIQVGLVEVDPATLVPILNPNLANAFTNAGFAELGASATATAYSSAAIADSSSAYATGGNGTTLAAMTATSEFLVEYHAEDVIVSNGAVDSAAAKNPVVSRVSSQVPNDGKVYKLLIRLRNTATPGASTTVTFGRIMLWNSQELRVEVASGRGDTNAQKGVAVNLAASSATVATSMAKATTGAPSTARITGNAANPYGSVKGGSGQLYGYDFLNTQASIRYVHFYNKTTQPTLSTDTPLFTVPLPASAHVSLAADIGLGQFSTGIEYQITTDDNTIPTTAGAAGDVVGTVLYA
jgi:hypothetical protein